METENECPICFEYIYPVIDCCDNCNYVWCHKCSNRGNFEICPFCRRELDTYLCQPIDNEVDNNSLCKKVLLNIKSKIRYIFIM